MHNKKNCNLLSERWVSQTRLLWCASNVPQQSAAPLAGPTCFSRLLHVNVLAYGFYGCAAPCTGPCRELRRRRGNCLLSQRCRRREVLRAAGLLWVCTSVCISVWLLLCIGAGGNGEWGMGKGTGRSTQGALNEAINKIIFYPTKEITAWHRNATPTTTRLPTTTRTFILREIHNTNRPPHPTPPHLHTHTSMHTPLS